MAVAEPFGDGDLRGRLPLVAGDQRPKRLDHVAHREQAAVRRDQFEEFRRQAADPGPLQHRGQRPRLLVGGEHRAADQPQQVRAFRNKRVEALQRWADAELRSVNGQIEFLLRRTLQEAGRLPKKSPAPVSDDEPETE